MAKQTKEANTTIRNNKLFCLNCGESHDLNMPIQIPEFSKKTKAFNVLHLNCKPTCKEPVPDQSKSMHEKAMFWINNGQIGASSMTMWNCLIGTENEFIIDHPWDPDDFSRCYKLLEMVPEWKNGLDKLRKLSPTWNNLVENWHKLNEFYLDQVKTKKANGMYEFMKTLIVR